LHLGEIEIIKELVLEELKKDNHGMDPDDLELLRDVDVYRFLRAKDGDVNSATNLLLGTLRWRNQMDIRNIREEHVKEELERNKVIVPGYDKEKRLVIFVRAKLHFPSTSSQTMMEDLVLFFVEQCRKLVNPESEMITLAFDLTGFTYSNMDYNLVKLLFKLFSVYYPNTLELSLVINSPWIFSSIWRVVKPWMDPKAYVKTIFISDGQIYDYIDKDQLPEEFGGTKTSMVPIK